MTFSDLNGMTVLQLRKLARENSVVLGAGIDKAGIIEKLLPVLSAGKEQPAENPSAEDTSLSEPKYQAAWHNTDTPRYNVRPAYQAPGSSSRPVWQNTSPSGQHIVHDQQHVQPLCPGSFTPRFGPAASVQTAAPSASQPAEPAEQSHTPAVSPLPEKRISIGSETGFGPRSFGPNSVPHTARVTDSFSPFQSQDTGIQAPSLEELLASGDYEEGGGILEPAQCHFPALNQGHLCFHGTDPSFRAPYRRYDQRKNQAAA